MTVDITVDAPAGIKAFEVQIVSDTLTPQELAGVGLCDNLNLVNPEDSVDSTGKLEDKSGIGDALKTSDSDRKQCAEPDESRILHN